MEVLPGVDMLVEVAHSWMPSGEVPRPRDEPRGQGYFIFARAKGSRFLDCGQGPGNRQAGYPRAFSHS
jgi:hypothetical protein